MTLKFEQIQNIILKNPNKATIDCGKEKASKLIMHVHGENYMSSIPKSDYFSSEDIYKEQTRVSTSNKDLFSRLLQQEDMVFNARGGSSYFSMSQSDEDEMHELLDSIRYGMSLRKWVQTVALQAYRCDPMGIIFMEVQSLVVDEGGNMNEPKAYPTYKSIYSIFDYLTNGRQLEYVVFKLKVGECIAYGIQDANFASQKGDNDSEYYRVVDDAKDLIVQKVNGRVILTTNITQKNPLPNAWPKVPGFVVSDLMQFDNPSEFVSPLDNVVELANSFLADRSVRNLQKLYHGFAKAIEPLLTCGDCNGTGFRGADPCKSCTPPGAEKGTGYKFKTKASDVARFPLEILEKGSFDFKAIFGYVTPDIESWNKQDMSLDDLERLIEMTYWGTVRNTTVKPAMGNNPGQPDTATAILSNDQPKEARLNMTADWAEGTENKIADYLGRYWFENGWKQSGISYGRDYILKSADELREIYLELKAKSAPDFMLDESLERYYRAAYQNNPIMMIKYLKMLDVEPFPHLGIAQAKGIITNFDDYNNKLYFGEWCNTIPEGMWINKTAVSLKKMLSDYVKAKGIKEPLPEPSTNPINN